jgi:hypothetical protein
MAHNGTAQVQRCDYQPVWMGSGRMGPAPTLLPSQPVLLHTVSVCPGMFACQRTLLRLRLCHAAVTCSDLKPSPIAFLSADLGTTVPPGSLPTHLLYRVYPCGVPSVVRVRSLSRRCANNLQLSQVSVTQGMQVTHE